MFGQMSGHLHTTLFYAAAFAWLSAGIIHAAGVAKGTVRAPGNGVSTAAQSAKTSLDDAFENITRGEETEGEYCPGYRAGNWPGIISTETEGCATGPGIGVVDHTMAFGINSRVANPNWTACGIPFLPNENERVCYKTTVFQCPDGYRIYLHPRNSETLPSSCTNETDEIPTAPFGGRFLQSPHYECVNPSENTILNYRKSEFCLYDLSLPECASGRIVIDNDLHYTQEMERRQRYHICTDYLQFFTDTTPYKRFCDSELSRLKLEIPSTRVTAIFWTDTSHNKHGFKLRVTCAESSA